MPYLGEIIPEGIRERYARIPQAPNAEYPPEKKALLIAERNAPDYIRTVVDPEYPQNILWQVNTGEENTGATQILEPTQPWEWGAIMVNAVPSDLLVPASEIHTDEKGLVPVQFVYDYPEEAQLAYARHLLAGIHALSEHQLPGEAISTKRPAAVAIENAVTVLGSGRTLATQHSQVIKTGLPVYTDSNVKFSRDLVLEHRIKQGFPNAHGYVDEVAMGMREELVQYGYESVADVDFYPRQQMKPYGYTARTPITDDMSLDTQARLYAPIMAAHYKVGAEQITSYVTSLNGALNPRSREKIKPQPSFRQYTYFLFDEDSGRRRLHVTWSPELLGGAALEDAGGYLRRGPEYTPPFELRQLRTYNRRVEQTLRKQLAPFGDILTPTNSARLAS